MTILLRDVIAIPEHTGAEDYVLRLTNSVGHEAMAAVIAEREAEGWPDKRLTPLVAGLAELQPWVRQWHDETDPTYQLNLADYLDEELRQRAAQVGMTLDQLRAWIPEPATRGRRSKA